GPASTVTRPRRSRPATGPRRGPSLIPRAAPCTTTCTGATPNSSDRGWSDEGAAGHQHLLRGQALAAAAGLGPDRPRRTGPRGRGALARPDRGHRGPVEADGGRGSDPFGAK